MFEGFEKTAIKYCRWLLSLDEAQRERHHRSLRRIAHAVRTAHGQQGDITPDCDCMMCIQWHSAAVKEILKQKEAERARRSRERSAPRLPKPTFVYLVRDERTGLIKIGRSKHPDARERTLQSENPQVALFFFGPADADMECELHREYAEYRVRGEWFRLSGEQVENIKRRVSAFAAESDLKPRPGEA